MIIDGKKIAAEICGKIQQTVHFLKMRKPCLALLLVGEHPSSQTYVRAKNKACAATGIESKLLEFPPSISQKDLLAHIDVLNQDPWIDGILVQLPLPAQIDSSAVMCAIDPAKDVDGFHPLNVGKMLLGDESGFLPCTPNGIKLLLEKSSIPVEGKKVVILGRSNIVGKPLAAILMQKKPHCNATVTIAHSQSEDLSEISLTADILVACVGQPHFVKKNMVREKAVVIDVGIHRLENGKLIGDVDFAQLAPHVSYITPVPGGVGPMTVAMLLQNTLLSYSKNDPEFINKKF